MAQRPMAEPSLSSELHPAIQAALHCMDVQLEEELARYRRNKRRLSPPAAGATSIAPSPQPSPTLAIAPALPLPPNVSGSPVPPAAPSGFVSDAVDEDLSDYLESSEHLMQSVAEDEAKLRSEPAPRMLDTLFTPLGIGSMLLLLLSSVTLGYILSNPTGLPFRANAPEVAEDESLVLTEPEAPPATPGNTSFSPDLSSQEFRDLNLDTLSTLPDDQAAAAEGMPATGEDSSDAMSSAAAREADEATPTNTTPSPRAGQPSPAARTNASAQPSPAARTNASAQPSPAARANTPAASPRPAPAASPRPQASRPAASPAPAPRPAPVAAAPATPQSYYYVITDYSGDRALEQAQQVVGDAYVRNFESGAVIQFGAFSEANGAEALAQDLRQQGISARVQRVERN